MVAHDFLCVGQMVVYFVGGVLMVIQAFYVGIQW